MKLNARITAVHEDEEFGTTVKLFFYNYDQSIVIPWDTKNSKPVLGAFVTVTVMYRSLTDET